MRAPPVLLLALLSLAGCAQYWAKPGASADEFRMTETGCQIAALQHVPQILETILVAPGYSSPVFWNCVAPGRCFPSGGHWTPPIFSTVDRNAPLRRRAVEVCLAGQGWQPVDRDGRPRPL